METKTSRIIAGSIGAAAILALSGFGIAFAAGNAEQPTPIPTSTAEPSTFVERVPGEVIEKPTPTPEPTPTEIPLDETKAPVEEEPAPAPAPEPEPAPAPAPAPAPKPAPAPAPAPAPDPVRCPAGSSPTENDGVNDTACMPNTAPNGGSCFEGDNGMLPECQPFRP